MIICRLILKDIITAQKVNVLAWDENWYLHDFNPKTESTPYNKIWITQDDKTGIHYIEDFLIDIRYIMIEGENQDRLAARIKSLVEVYSEEEVLAMAKHASSPEDIIKAIYHIGIISNQIYNQHYFGVFEAAFAHSNAEVRKAAILATVCAGWSEFKEPLQGLQNNDADDSVRERAHRTLEKLFN